MSKITFLIVVGSMSLIASFFGLLIINDGTLFGIGIGGVCTLVGGVANDVFIEAKRIKDEREK